MTTNPSPGALDLGRAWNLLADAMHALDALDTPGRSNQMRKDLIHAKIEEAHGIVQRSLAPGAVPDPKGDARAEILKALKNYRCSKTVDGDGDGMPLLDLLSPGETVAEGHQELGILAEYLEDKLADYLAPPAQAGLAPNGVREALAKLVAHLDACIPHSRVKEIDVSTELMNLMEAAGTALSTPTGDTDQAPASDDEKETAAIAAGYARCLRALLDGLGGVWVTRAMANASNPEYFLSLGREIAGRLGPAPVVTERPMVWTRDDLIPLGIAAKHKESNLIADTYPNEGIAWRLLNCLVKSGEYGGPIDKWEVFPIFRTPEPIKPTQPGEQIA